MADIIEDKYILEQSVSKTIVLNTDLIQLNLNLRLNTNPLKNKLTNEIIDNNFIDIEKN